MTGGSGVSRLSRSETKRCGSVRSVLKRLELLTDYCFLSPGPYSHARCLYLCLFSLRPRRLRPSRPIRFRCPQTLRSRYNFCSSPSSGPTDCCSITPRINDNRRHDLIQGVGLARSPSRLRVARPMSRRLRDWSEGSDAERPSDSTRMSSETFTSAETRLEAKGGTCGELVRLSRGKGLCSPTGRATYWKEERCYEGRSQ